MNLNNELVAQKDHILALVNDGRYQEALTLLEFARQLWTAAGYGYKTYEIRACIRAAVWDRVCNAEHAATSRKWQRVYDNIPS